MMTDPIADMLTRIRNAGTIGKSEVLVPYSTLKFMIAQILMREGYIGAVERARAKLKKFDELKIILRYKDQKTHAIRSLRRISKPGRRVYVGYRDLNAAAQSRGMVIVSTPKGIMTQKEAQEKKLGGEIICEVY